MKKKKKRDWDSFLVMLQVTSKPIVIYPNSGETWDGEKKQWVVSDFCDTGPFVGDLPIPFVRIFIVFFSLQTKTKIIFVFTTDNKGK